MLGPFHEAEYRCSKSGGNSNPLIDDRKTIRPGGERSCIYMTTHRGGGPLVLRALAYAIEGNVGYIIGGYARTKDALDVGKYTLTLIKNDENRWLIMSDMDNGNSKH